MLSGPIHIDKMDYLHRDSLHAGVPYGRHFDQQRLLGSLCLNESGNGLAITDKGKTAAELRQLWDPDFWTTTFAAADQWDRLIRAFNDRVGLVSG